MARGRRSAAAAPIVPAPLRVTSRKHARRLTSSFHTLTHALSAATTDAERAACKEQLEQMGGVTAYQQASALNTALNPTSRWVRRALARTNDRAANAQIPRVLEIGAVNTQLLDAQGLKVRAIDLHSSQPRIEQKDFFALPHGGEPDKATGAVVPYDAVVCSMVLNCVPDGRRRFEMLVGMRACLRAGGRAFVTLPRSCLDHSFTLSERAFVDVLAAVGLPVLAAGDGAAAAPASTKIIYFECLAGAPSAEAAVRAQRARHEARAAHRAKADAARPKSAGAAFDVDVGGYLGFGVRVPRSHVASAAEAGRAARDQAVCRLEFLRQQAGTEEADALLAAEGRADPNKAAAAAASTPLARDEDCEVDESVSALAASGNGGDATAAMARQIVDVARADASKLDYTLWRWFEEPASSAVSARGAPTCHWRHESSGRAEERASDRQARSGWQWTGLGWKQSAPLHAKPGVVAPTSAARSTTLAAVRSIGGASSRLMGMRRRRARDRLGVREWRRDWWTSSWWRRLVLPPRARRTL